MRTCCTEENALKPWRQGCETAADGDEANLNSKLVDDVNGATNLCVDILEALQRPMVLQGAVTVGGESVVAKEDNS